VDLVGFKPALWLMAGDRHALRAACWFRPRSWDGHASDVREFLGKSRGRQRWPRRASSCSGREMVWFVVACRFFLYAAGWRFVERGFCGVDHRATASARVGPGLVARSPDGSPRGAERDYGGPAGRPSPRYGLVLRDQSLWRPGPGRVPELRCSPAFSVKSSLHST